MSFQERVDTLWNAFIIALNALIFAVLQRYAMWVAEWLWERLKKLLRLD